MMKKPMQVLVEALGHPEGPCPLPDGRVAFANSFRGEIGFWDPRGGSGTYAVTGGGPNACVLGSDGDLYCTNMPTVGEWTASDPRPPAIQRVSPDGKVEIVATTADGKELSAPNDLVFGPDGRLYFTDSGHWDPIARPHCGYICMIEPDGSSHILEELDPVYPNGIVIEPDGALVWVESYARRLVRRSSAGHTKVLRVLDEGHVPDGLKIDIEGNFWITSFSSGGVDVVARDGVYIDFLETGGVPTNCVFSGDQLYVTELGPKDLQDPMPMKGRLLRIEVGVFGMPLYYGSIRR
jgi:gluconolactonase